MQPDATAARTHVVLLFYKYVLVDNPSALAESIQRYAQELALQGRVIVATEGINGTLEGTREHTDAFVRFLHADERFADMHIKRSAGNGNSFPRLSVKVRKEIVGTGFTKEEANPIEKTAPRLTPEELRTWYENNNDFVVVDMRNNYEFASGHFKGSVHPDISASRHLPIGVEKLKPLKDKKIVTVCTGGVRCEKMSAYLMSKGFTDVHQLDGGIHSYMEKYPGEDFLGTLYTFDQRLTMDFGGTRELIGECYLCKTPTEQYVDCAEDTCHFHFLACSNCVSENGRAFCSDECRNVRV